MPLCEYDMNPDEDFVLHGKAAPRFWARPRHLTNSELTTTTLTADGQPAFSSSKLLDSKSVSFQNCLENENAALSNSGMLRNRGGDQRRTTSTMTESLTDNELVRTSASFTREGRPQTRTSLRGLSSSAADSWYTRLRNAPKYGSNRVTEPAPITRNVGSLGAKLAIEELDKEIDGYKEIYGKLGDGPYVRQNDLARRYFPVTLGTLFPLGHDYGEGFGREEVTSPPPEVLQSRSRSRSRSRNEGRGVRVTSSLDTENLATPYDLELGRLRMERLRIEEERLLELKRQEELERTRGPKPKWYELKNTDFHVEANRNNSLLRNERYWDDMLKYRSQLANASKEFRRSWDGVVLY